MRHTHVLTRAHTCARRPLCYVLVLVAARIFKDTRRVTEVPRPPAGRSAVANESGYPLVFRAL